MCGIAGLWGYADAPMVQNMMDRLCHRGPDAEGIYASLSGILGHKRLSIISTNATNDMIEGVCPFVSAMVLNQDKYGQI